MSHVVRKFNICVAALTCVVASLPALAAHKAPVQTDVAGVPPLTASALADPLSPANPFNTGADPVSMPGDARMAVFPYSRDQIFRVMTAPLKLTTIELAPGEKLVSDPGLGDSVQWIIDTDGANHVFVKPTKPGLVNTMHLSTNQREYDFTLVSSPLGGLFYQSVRFRYPQSLMEKVRARDDAVGAGTGGQGTARSPVIRVLANVAGWKWHPASWILTTPCPARLRFVQRRFSTMAASCGSCCRKMRRTRFRS